MSLRFLLDTNIISETLRPAPKPSMLEKLHNYQDEIAIPAIVWHELWFGCYRLALSPRRTTIELYLRQVVALLPILAYDQDAADWHANERARLTSLGLPPPFADSQIAAIAATNKLTLVTLNEKDYKIFQGLQVTAW